MVYDRILLTQCFLCSDSESSFFDSVDDSSGIDDLAVREAIAVESDSAQDEVFKVCIMLLCLHGKT
jgi:hypothetical protein